MRQVISEITLDPSSQNCNKIGRTMKGLNNGQIPFARDRCLAPELMHLNCLQRASIDTRVSLSTFACVRHCQALRRPVHGFVSLLFEGSKTTMTGSLHALPRISSL